MWHKETLAQPSVARRLHEKRMENGASGYCAVTSQRGDLATSCDSGDKGLFYAKHKTECFTSCAECDRCRFVSFSAKHEDCSWFYECKGFPHRLPRTAGKNTFTHHRTWLARSENGSLLLPGPALQLIHARRATTVLDYFERPARVFFHEQSTLQMWAASSRPKFSTHPTITPADLQEWADATRKAFPSKLSGLGSCVVVGSSDALLQRKYGGVIDRFPTVIRVNKAPTRNFVQHVGNRTDIRMWGALPLPDEGYQNTNFRPGEESIVLYCPPVEWLSVCWRRTPTWPHRQHAHFE